MKKAVDLLFGSEYHNPPLFRSQLDLVLQLLSSNGSAYYMPPNSSPEILSKAQGRLKTYISQLLSDTVIRVVTEDFKNSLRLILDKKLQGAAVDPYNEIITALEAKNASLSNQQPVTNTTSKDTIKDEIRNANYITVITARPINMDTAGLSKGFSIRQYFFQDLIANLTNRDHKIKYYRFNFPLETFGDQFWNGLTKIMVKFLKDYFDNSDLIDFLYNEKFSLTTATLQSYHNILKNGASIGQGDGYLEKKMLIVRMATEIIERLYRNKIITVFYVDQPIFSIPIIAINPDESTSKVYALLENDADINSIYSLEGENMLLWKIFVWYKIKGEKMGKVVEYKVLKD